jgi:hypothetical protein
MTPHGKSFQGGAPKDANPKDANPENTPVPDGRRIIERPDGIYWQDTATGKEFGPFATLAAAEAEMEYTADSAYEPGEGLDEAEGELGIADWLDPDTGQPAEESVPRIEDH